MVRELSGRDRPLSRLTHAVPRLASHRARALLRPACVRSAAFHAHGWLGRISLGGLHLAKHSPPAHAMTGAWGAPPRIRLRCACNKEMAALYGSYAAEPCGSAQARRIALNMARPQ
jgi:hypothetical protein